MLSSSMIIEGFICPECQQDMSSAELLKVHFELYHLKNKNSKEIYNQTSFISSDLNNESALKDEVNLKNVSYKFMKEHFNSNQLDGSLNNYTTEFKKLRDNTIGRYVIQINKLLITLDKLITFDINIYNDETKRDNHYKSIVSWISDKDVDLCPNCAKTFSLINRKHHCRLCGAIMCYKCSQFISFTLARKLTDQDSILLDYNEKSSEVEFKIKRSDSITSINSYFLKTPISNKEKQKSKISSNYDQTYLRLCLECGKMLEKKYQNLRDKILNPEFLNLYNEIHSFMTESQRLYPVYIKMAKSLNNGETIYQLGNAEEVKNKLVKLFQKIELTSNLIMQYGINQNEPLNSNNLISNDQFKLQKNIKSFAVNFLRENSFNLPHLPTSEEYQNLKRQRELYLIEEMKRTELEKNKLEKKNDDKFSKRLLDIKSLQSQNVSIDNSNGWIPNFEKNILFNLPESNLDKLMEKGSSQKDDDNNTSSSLHKNDQNSEKNALKIQIQLVEAYLKDAIKHNKHEEVNILQQNLNELFMTLNKSE